MLQPPGAMLQPPVCDVAATGCDVAATKCDVAATGLRCCSHRFAMLQPPDPPPSAMLQPPDLRFSITAPNKTLSP